MSLDPVQLGQVLGFGILFLAALVATLRQGFSSWSKQQEEAREKEREAQEEAREKEQRDRRKEKRREIRSRDRALKKAFSGLFRKFDARLVRLEHAVEGLQRERESEEFQRTRDSKSARHTK